MLSRPGSAPVPLDTPSRPGRVSSKRKGSRTEERPPGPIQGVSCRLRLILPKTSWLGQITQAHPKEQVDFVSRSELGEGLRLAMLRLHSADPDIWMTDLSRLPLVVEVSGMRLSQDLANVHVIHRGKDLLPLFSKVGLLWELPFPIVNGEALCGVVGTSVTVHRFVEDLRELSMNFSIDQVRKQGIDQFRELPNPVRLRGKARLTDSLEGMYSRSELFPGTPVASPGSAPRAPSSEVGHLTVCRLRLSLPEKMWITLLNRKYPEATTSVVGQLVADRERTLVDLKVHSGTPQDWAATIISLPEVLSVDKLGSAGLTSTLRVTFKTHPLYQAFNTLNLMWRLPAPVRDGVIHIAMVGSDESIRKMVEMWRAHHLEVRIDSVRHTEEESKALLTQRQEYIFRKAMTAGFYDVPRRVTLSDLSRSLGLAVSSLSEIMAIVEKKMLEKADDSR